MDEIRFEWDKANLAHIAKHRVSQQEAEEAFLNDPVDLDYQYQDEERWVVVGQTNRARYLVLVWTLRRGAIRIVTADDAGKRNQSTYLKRRSN